MASELETAIEMRDLARDAYKKALNSDSYGKSGGQINVNVKHQPIDKLKDQLDYWDIKVDELSNDSSGILLTNVTVS